MSYDSYLSHHGVLGMKWGIRRFQNQDGTLTEAGKSRYSGDSKASGLSSERKQQLAKGAKLAAGFAVGVAAGYAISKSNPAVLNKLISNGSKFVANHKGDVVSGLKTAGKAVGDRAKKAAVKAGNAAIDGAMLSVGTIAISKLTKKFEAKEGDSEQQKIAKKVALDSSVAAVNSFTKASKSGGNSNNKGNQLGKDEGARISSIVGAPKKEPVDRSGSAYQSLFKDSSGNNRSSDERSIIKSMASAGYSIDQIQQYLDTLEHSGVNMYTYSTFYPDELYHHGIKGMKWGVRRFQNPDGSLKHPKLGFNSDPERAALRKEYKAAKKDYKKTDKEYQKLKGKVSFGMSGMINPTATLGSRALSYYSMRGAQKKINSKQLDKAVKEKKARYVDAAAKYRGVSKKQIEKRMTQAEIAKGVSKLLLGVGMIYVSANPKASAAVGRGTAKVLAKGIRTGAKVTRKVMDVWADYKYNHDPSIVDAPSYQVMGEVRNIAGYLRG